MNAPTPSCGYRVAYTYFYPLVVMDTALHQEVNVEATPNPDGSLTIYIQH